MLRSDSAQRIANLQRDATADAAVDLVEDKRRDAAESREDRREREHNAGELAAGGNAREWSRIVTDVERDLKHDVFGAVSRNGLSPNQQRREAAVGHAQSGQLRINGARKPFGALLPLGAEHRSSRREVALDLLLAAAQLREVQMRGIGQCELGTRLAAGRENLLDRRAVLARQTEDHIAALLHFAQAIGIRRDARVVVLQLAPQLVDRVGGGIELFLDTA